MHKKQGNDYMQLLLKMFFKDNGPTNIDAHLHIFFTDFWDSISMKNNNINCETI